MLTLQEKKKNHYKYIHIVVYLYQALNVSL